jgi:environmental stress-induced protein Ves
MRILRAADRAVTPWKNGGGTTAEIAVHPAGAGLDDFDWRVSVADVKRGGPFSRFAGIDRKLALLKGALSLTIEGQGAVALTPASPPLEFPGDVPTEAVLNGDAAQDLNVMTRRGVCMSTVTRQTSPGPIVCDPHASACVVYFLSHATLFGGTKEFPLHPGDAVSLTPGRNLNLRGDAEFYRIEIFARS